MGPEQTQQVFDALLAHAITEDSPKAHLVPTPIQLDPKAVAVAVGPDTTAASTVAHQRIAAGNLAGLGREAWYAVAGEGPGHRPRAGAVVVSLPTH